MMNRRLIIALLFAFAVAPFPALAEDTKEETPAPAAQQSQAYIYAPDACEFTTTFPAEPFIKNICEDSNGGQRCYDRVSYTKVFDMATSVNFRLVCNTIDNSVYEQYGADVMQATLRAMTRGSTVAPVNTGYREGNGYKQASLVGEGTSGKTDMIYISQMWIGQQSALTVEAELVGGEHAQADQMFSDILRSISAKAEKPDTKPE